AATAKWYRSIRVLPNLEHLGNWLTRFNLPVFKGVGRRRARRSNADDPGDPCHAAAAAAAAGTNSPNAGATGANALTNVGVPTSSAAAARTATTGHFAGPGCGPWPGAPRTPAVAAGFAATAPPPQPADLLLTDQPLNDPSMPGAAARAEALAEAAAEAAAAAAATEEPAIGADPYGTWYGEDVPSLARYRPSRLQGRGQYVRSGGMPGLAAAAAPPLMPSPELPRALHRTCGAMEGRWARARHIDGALHDIEPPPGRYDKSAMSYHQHASQTGGWSQRGSVRPSGHHNAGTRRPMSAPTLDGGYDNDLGIAAECGRAGDRGGGCRSAERGGDGTVLLGDSLEPWLAAATTATMPPPSSRLNSAAFWRDRTDMQYANGVDGQPAYVVPQASRLPHRKRSESTEPLAAALALTSARSHTPWSELPLESPSVAAAAAAAAAAAEASAAPPLPTVPPILRRPSSHPKGHLPMGRSRNQGVDDVIFLQQPQEQIRFRDDPDPSAVRLPYETQHPSPPLRRGSYDHPLDASLGGVNDMTPTLIDQGDGGSGAVPLARQQPHQSYTSPHQGQYHKAPTDPGWRPLRPPYTHAPTHDIVPYGSANTVRAMPRPPAGSVTRPRAQATSDPVAVVTSRPRRPSYEMYGREIMKIVSQ
ncbi:hypothetical protein Vafri_16794, partial [Volvox africanus]